MNKGIIPIARSIFNTPEWREKRPRTRFEAWLDLIAMASYTERTVSIKSEQVLLSRGEIHISQRQLAERWQWPLTNVNRYLATLAKGDDPRIEVHRKRIVLKTESGTESGTQIETPCNIIRLCKYEYYNNGMLWCGTESGTPSGAVNGTQENKGIETPTYSYQYLKKKFVQACASVSPENSDIARKCAEEITVLRQMDGAVDIEYRNDSKASKEYGAMIWLWYNYPTLQTLFPEPLIWWQMADIHKRYHPQQVADVVSTMYNNSQSLKGKRSFFHTFNRWAKTDFTINK